MTKDFIDWYWEHGGKRADNAMQKGGAKQRRESALCKLLPEREVTGWTGAWLLRMAHAGAYQPSGPPPG